MVDRSYYALWKNNGQVLTEITGGYSIGNSQFEEKATYTLTIHMVGDNGNYLDITYSITPLNNHMPGLIITGNSNDDYKILGSDIWYHANFYNSFTWSGNISSQSITITRNGNLTGSINTLWQEFYGYLSGDEYLSISIDADFPIFTATTPISGSNEGTTNYLAQYVFAKAESEVNFTTYLSEIENGDYSNVDMACNYSSITDSIPNNKVWSIQDYFKANGTITNTKGYDFKILPTAKIAMYVTNQIEGDATPNAHIVISEYPCMVKPYNSPDNAYAESSSIDSNYWWGEWQDTVNGITYIGYGSTNIPIFESQEDAQKYFNGELTIDDAINSGDTTIRTSTIGDYLDTTDIPTINLSSSGVGVTVYALSDVQIKDIMSNYLYTTDPQTQTTIGDALWLWGNNPIDFMVDCYYIPFDITSFYTTINANLKFGTYQFTGTSFPTVKETNGNRLTLFNTTFEGVYGDWRDFTQFNYDLYLPFYGFFPLDIYRYLNHTIKCEMMFDLTTHNIRYYLYVDGKITDRIDTSVGISIPIMATDMVNKSKHDRDIRYGVLSDSISAGTSIGMGVTSADIGGAVTGVVSGVSHIISGVKQYQELNTQASQNVVGGFSSAMNTYDIMYAYLRITERQTVIPTNVNNIYNYPSYYMGTLSNLHGYCEIEDIQLYSNATEEEQEEIKGLLKGGVIF